MRRGAEAVARSYPSLKGPAKKSWSLPPPIRGRLLLIEPGALADATRVCGQPRRKPGFLADAGALREMKDVRNMIAHDYAGAKAAEIFAYCRAQKPAFDEIWTRVEAYIRRFSE